MQFKKPQIQFDMSKIEIKNKEEYLKLFHIDFWKPIPVSNID